MTKPTITEVWPLIVAYYRKPENGAGGSFHIVLDDDNIETKHVQFCLDYAKEQGDYDGVVIGELLLKMSKSQRKRICNKLRSPFND